MTQGDIQAVPTQVGDLAETSVRVSVALRFKTTHIFSVQCQSSLTLEGAAVFLNGDALVIHSHILMPQYQLFLVVPVLSAS